MLSTSEENATNRPSAEIDGWPSVPALPTPPTKVAPPVCRSRTYTPGPDALTRFSVEKATYRPSPEIDGCADRAFHSFGGRLTTEVTPVARFRTYTSSQTEDPGTVPSSWVLQPSNATIRPSADSDEQKSTPWPSPACGPLAHSFAPV